MKITINKPIEVDVKAVTFKIPVYFNDITFDGLDFNTLMFNFNVNNIPQNFTDNNEPIYIFAKVDILTGFIIGWKETGSEIDIFAKVVDEGEYSMLGNEQYVDHDEYDVLGKYEGYVPSIFECNEIGYGDYFNMTISKDGKIKNFSNDLENKLYKMFENCCDYK